MKQYIVFLPNGEIARTGTCAPNDLSLQARLGEQVMEGVADCAAHYILGGAIANIPAQPSSHHAFNYTTKQWVDPRTLEDLRAESSRRIDVAYSTAIQQDVSYMGTSFQADKASQELITTTLTVLTPLGGTPVGFFWKDTSNNKVLMSLQELQGLSQVIFAQGWTAFQHRTSKKSEIAVSNTPGTIGW